MFANLTDEVTAVMVIYKMEITCVMLCSWCLSSVSVAKHQVLISFKTNTSITERRCWVFITLPSNLAVLTLIFRGFSLSKLGQYFEVGHNHFHTRPLQFVCRNHPSIWCCIT